MIFGTKYNLNLASSDDQKQSTPNIWMTRICKEKLEWFKIRKELLGLEQEIIIWDHRVVLPETFKDKMLKELTKTICARSKLGPF